MCCRWRVGLMVHCWRRQEQDDGWMGWELAGWRCKREKGAGMESVRRKDTNHSDRSVLVARKKGRNACSRGRAEEAGQLGS